MLLRELRYAIRNLTKAPGFAVTAILTLALAIGASTAVFTVVDSVILKPLGYRHSGRLVVIWERVKFLATSAVPYTGANPRHEDYWKQRSRAFSDMCLLGVGTRGVSLGVDHPHLVGSIRAEPNFLNVLEVTPFIGRNFTPYDAVKGRDTVAIITYSMWQQLFHADPNVIGRSLRVSGISYQVIGVLPKDFRFPKRSVLSSFPSKQGVATAPEVQILMPVAVNAADYGWDSDFGNWIALGRLKAGVSVQQAQSQLDIILRQMIDELARGQNLPPDALLAYVQPLQDAMVGSTRQGLWMLMAAVIAVLLIACVNLANAQLARAVSREREAAVRSALGASKWQMVLSWLSESTVLAVVGGAGGILLAFGALALFKAYSPVELPRIAEIQPNLPVLLFALVLVIGSALLFGIMPGLNSVRADPQKALQQNSNRAAGSRKGRRLRLALIGLQVFGCTTLLLITGLFAKSLATLLSGDRGFDATNVVAAEVSVSGPAYTKAPERSAFDEGALNRLRSLPGVKSAALVSAMPLDGETWLDGIRRTDKQLEHPPLWNMRWVSADYFQLMRERLVAGRFLDERDRDTYNAVISEASAKAGWPGEDPIGHQFKWWDHVCTVVGVVADSRINSLKTAPANMVYLPFQTNPPYSTYFLVRSAQAPDNLVPDVRRAIWNQDPEVTIARTKTMNAQVNDSLSTERFQTFVLIAFGIAALLLAMLGVYGVLSYTVAGRVQEIGVRIALGATRSSIYELTMLEAAAPVVVGLIAGWAASAGAGKLVQKLLYGVTAMDWSVTFSITILLLACASAAAFLPARRAAGVDPMRALRTE